jgi:predicted nucleotidyltransferase
MNKVVSETIAKLEDENDIIVLYCAEVGSRAWGYASKSSDYDVKFIYKKKDHTHYLNLDQNNDQIRCNLLKQKTEETEETDYEFEGWCIYKAMTLLKSSNASVMEWIYSPIKYINRNNFLEGCTNILSKMHTNVSLIYHYKNNAMVNWKTYIEGKRIVKTKKYLHVIRPIAVCVLLIKAEEESKGSEGSEGKGGFDEIIVKPIDECIETIFQKNLIDYECMGEIIKTINDKKLGTLKDSECNKIIDKWIGEQFAFFENKMETKKDNRESMNIENKNRQNVVSKYNKFHNVLKSLNTIVNRNNEINRSEYLKCIGDCLEFLYMHKIDPNVEHSTNIRTVLNHVEEHVPVDVKTEILKICDMKVEKTDQRLVDIVEHQVTEVCRMFNIDRTIVMNRNDVITNHFKHCFNTLWLIDNPNETSATLPKDIFNVYKVDYSSKSEQMRNLVIEKWLNGIDKEYEKDVNILRDKIQNIKDEKMKIVYKESIKNVSIGEFNSFIKKMLFC